MQNTKIQKSSCDTENAAWAGGQTNSRGHRGVYGDTGIIAAHCPSPTLLCLCLLCNCILVYFFTFILVFLCTCVLVYLCICVLVYLFTCILVYL